jgi:uncharacterized membrane protein YbhN (UPF0104 family)
LLRIWKELPSRLRSAVALLVKLFVTSGAFYLLLTHRVQGDGGESLPIWRAIRDQLLLLELGQVWPWLMAAVLIKCVGIFSSMTRWHLLLVGQGIRFNFSHIVGSFLIGRFFGTFLPSTLGLDGFKFYDAAKFSERGVETAAATVVEKVVGVTGIFLTFLITLPLGVHILGESASTVAWVTVPLALGLIGGVFLVLFRPGIIQWGVQKIPGLRQQKIQDVVVRASQAAAAYRGNGRLLLTVLGLSFVVHFTTASMYYFTALAVGAMSADFWGVCFASSIQIFATVISPFTIAGEGVREIVQALLLAKHIGASSSILSAALGFWAAEALTLAGAVVWWVRKKDYRPRVVDVSKVKEAVASS